MKFCGIPNPYKGIRVYTRCAMGMPGSETTLKELMSRVLGEFIVKGFIAKIADDLYVGGDMEDELLPHWQQVLQALAKNNQHTKPPMHPKPLSSSVGYGAMVPFRSAPPHLCISTSSTTKNCVCIVIIYRILQGIESCPAELLFKNATTKPRGCW